VRVVKAFTRTKHEIHRFSDAKQGFADKTIQVRQYLAFLMPSLTFLINAGIARVIWVGGLQTMRGSLTLGEIVAFTNYLLTTMTPLVIMSNLAQVLAAANASAQRIRRGLEEPVLGLDRQGAQDLPEETPGQVTFEEVCFSYDGDGGELALDEISFAAQPEETLAILGATGSGKTTLVNLVPRFYDVTRGRVTIDGRDVRDLRQKSMLANICIVLQEGVLFSGTVAENTRYANPEASDEEMVEAARTAQAHDFIMLLPNAYDTRVEERGANLSGGQKQRIAMARAILPRPTILILDDSTSSVDVDRESRIQESLNRIR
jgi:ATP-binding cassette subfamily B multidrug efflux pump